MKRRKHYYRPRRPPGSVLPYMPPPEPKPAPEPIPELQLTNTVRMRDDENMTTPKPGPPKTIQAKPSKPEPAKREPFARRDILNFLLAHPNETLTLSDIIAGTGRLNTTVASVLVRLRTDAEAGTLGIEGTIRGLGNGQYRYTPAPVTTTIAEQYAPGAPPETPAASNGHALKPTPTPASELPAPPSKRLWEEFGVTSRGVILAQDEDGALWKVEEIDL